MGRVLVTRTLPSGSLDPLLEGGHEVVQRAEDVPYSPEELREAARDVDGIICLLTDRIDQPLLDAASGRLKVVANVAVGYDNIDVVAAKKKGVAVCNTPGVLDETTSDLAFFLMLAASRRTSEAERDLRSGRWSGWGVNQYLGRDVHGATLGVVGWGRIGKEVGRRGIGFGMRVLHHCRTPSGSEGYVADLDELLQEADVVTLHVPLSDETRHLIDARRLTLMKPTAVLVNTSRGPIIDEEALAEALHRGEIFAAGLDVYEHEPSVHPRLLDAPGAVLLPHIGSASVQTRTAMAQMAARSVVQVLQGDLPGNVVTS